jgi:NAD(P)-dependent dehydrogenase (short-subunit alcohol dehydrogenase family)
MPIKDVADKSLSELISLEGRSAVVTGAARGIGFAVARRLAEAGAFVVLADLDGKGAEEAAGRIAAEFGARAAKGVARGLAVNVADEGAVATLADAAVQATGRLDIWVNNAGIFPGGPTVDYPAELFDRVLEINLKGAFLGAREAARRMTGQDPKGGVIVNIASVAGLIGRRGLAAYTASKHGVVGLTKSLALEFGGDQIRVIGIAPSAVATPGVAERMAAATGAEAERVQNLNKRVAEGLASPTTSPASSCSPPATSPC